MITILQYSVHKILQSNYKMLISLFIYSLIYLSFNGSNIIYCMMEGDLSDQETKMFCDSDCEKKSKQLQVEIRDLQNKVEATQRVYKDSQGLVRAQTTTIAQLQAEKIELMRNLNEALAQNESITDTNRRIDTTVHNLADALAGVFRLYVNPINSRAVFETIENINRTSTFEQTQGIFERMVSLLEPYLYDNFYNFSDANKVEFQNHISQLTNVNAQLNDELTRTKSILVRHQVEFSQGILQRNATIQRLERINLQLNQDLNALQTRVGNNFNMEQGVSRRPAIPVPLAQTDAELAEQKNELFSLPSRRRK